MPNINKEQVYLLFRYCFDLEVTEIKKIKVQISCYLGSRFRISNVRREDHALLRPKHQINSPPRTSDDLFCSL